MFRIDDPSAVAALPAPEAAGTEGYFTEGTPGVQNPTLVRAAWLNMIQEELRALIIAAGLTPSKTTYNQLLTALRSAGVFQTPTTGDRSTKAATTQMFANEFAASLATNGYQKLPSGLIMQWGICTGSTAGTANTFPIAFPTACYSLAALWTGAVPTIGQYIAANNLSQTGFTLYSNAGTPSSNYIAIGR